MICNYKKLFLCSFKHLLFVILEASKKSSSDEEEPAPLAIVNTDIGEMPEGAVPSDGDGDDDERNNDPHKALDINLDE